MRIAVCLSNFHPTVGGAENQLLLLARRWVEQRCPTTVFTRRVKGSARIEAYRGIEIRRVLRTVPLGPLFGLSYIASLALSLTLHRRRFDVVLAGQAPWEAVACGAARWWVGRPTLVRLANTGPFGDLAQLHRAKGSRLLTRWFLRNAGYLAPSEHAVGELVNAGCDPARVHRVTNGVETHAEVRHSDEASRTVLFVGRLAAQKNPQLLLRAWKHVNASERYQLLLAGDGPMQHELTHQASGLKGVHFLGRQSDMSSIYRQATVFALPSRSEGCSNALLEAMSFGLCPVVSDVGGNVDVVTHQENGLTFPDDDADALAQRLQAVLNDSAQRQRLASAARTAVIERHNIDDCARRYLEIFQAHLTVEQQPSN